jgi:hypothetical protein
MTMRLIKSAVITAFVGLLAIPFAPPANADASITHGSDIAYTQYLNDDIITVCDREADNHGVYAEYYLSDGSSHEVGDANGSASGCGQHNWTQSPYWVTAFRVCETTEGCSIWKFTDGPGGS